MITFLAPSYLNNPRPKQLHLQNYCFLEVVSSILLIEINLKLREEWLANSQIREI